MSEIKEKIRQKKWLFIVLAAVAIIAMLIIIIFGIHGRKGSGSDDGLKSGYIVIGGSRSATQEDLFLIRDGKHLINMDKLDLIISADVISGDNDYSVITSQTQLIIIKDSDEYIKDLVSISEDDTYTAPVTEAGYTFADTEKIFGTFGYSTSYRYSADGRVVELTLNRAPEYVYGDIFPLDESGDIETETEPQAEEALIKENAQNGEGGDPATVPRPSETSADGKALNQSGPAGATAGKEHREIEERPEQNPPKKTKEEFESQWEFEKSDLEKIFSGGTPSVGNIPVDVRSDDFIAFNPMGNGIYYDTISVQHDTESDGSFITATFASDWSDLAGNVVNEQSKAYYQGLPGIYSSTIKKLVGEKEGTRLYNFIKEHADKMVLGGYISARNERGAIESVWSDDYVGDGVRASELSLSEWQNQLTDDGLTYDVVRHGDGFSIIIHYN